ncbi:potassium/sodium hyperpolarization-activated cyclic nucleotide-gated channel 1-like [Amblyraja radiata]|uniref:potassium/sodium hyperpolarization-activated cyclic nucleotide-gated channel 1-like n=1 Tax=Amblyraja radiata TaxID=386614 RepID=UPI001401FE63|nr:potassium/sodium hyperpolarization-activated cyclic nucleotide-gated channel 1-like [Amblyraja radiata]
MTSNDSDAGEFSRLSAARRSLGKARWADYQQERGLNTGSAAFQGCVATMSRGYLKADTTDKFVIHPYSTFRHNWLLGMMTWMFANFIIIPLAVSFFTEAIYTGFVWICYIVISDVIAIIDIVLNFYIGYVDEKLEVIIMDRKKIKNHYLNSWFAVDLVAMMPVDYVFLGVKHAGGLDVSPVGYATSRLVRLVKLTRIMSLLRLLRFSNLMRYMQEWKELHEWDVGMTRVLHLAYWFAVAVLFCHWNACFQFLIVMIQDFPEKSWVILQGLMDESIRVQYTYALFRSVSHMMCLDYAALQMPEGFAEIWILNLSMLTGSIMYALLLAQVTAMVANSDSSRRMYTGKLHEYKEFLRHHHIPKDLRLRVLNQLAHQFKGKWFDESMILGELSESLREEVIHHNCSSLVENAPFFKDCDKNFMIAMLGKLKFRIAQRGEVIFNEGAVGNFMLFIEKGTMHMEGLQFATKLADGAFLGVKAEMKHPAQQSAQPAMGYWSCNPMEQDESLQISLLSG